MKKFLFRIYDFIADRFIGLFSKIQRSTLCVKVSSELTTNPVYKLVAKIGIYPFLLGAVLLLLAAKFAFVNAFVSKMWFSSGWLIVYVVADYLFLLDVQTFKEIKNGNIAVAIATAALLLGAAYLWT